LCILLPETSMLERIFGGDTFAATTQALDATTLRHQVISNNLANVNTPGFKRQEVVFEDRLARALAQQKTSGGRALGEPISDIHANVVTIHDTGERLDGNNVNIEEENIKLAINTLRFEALSQQVSGFFGGLKAVINGR